MLTLFELMDIEAGSVVGFYETEEEALAVVRHTAATYGDSAALSLALSGGTEQEITEVIARGHELLDRALRMLASPASSTRAP